MPTTRLVGALTLHSLGATVPAKKEENSSLIAIDVICWLDVHMSNLHEPVGAGEEHELITIFYSPQKIVIVIPPLAATMK